MKIGSRWQLTFGAYSALIGLFNALYTPCDGPRIARLVETNGVGGGQVLAPVVRRQWRHTSGKFQGLSCCCISILTSSTSSEPCRSTLTLMSSALTLTYFDMTSINSFWSCGR